MGVGVSSVSLAAAQGMMASPNSSPDKEEELALGDLEELVEEHQEDNEGSKPGVESPGIVEKLAEEGKREALLEAQDGEGMQPKLVSGDEEKLPPPLEPQMHRVEWRHAQQR